MPSPCAFPGAILVIGSLLLPLCAAQPRPYVGLAGGVSTLSADARSLLGSDPATSSYKPDDGAAADVFVGLHWNDYLSVQADYLWNRNRLTLDTLHATSSGGLYYDQPFQTRQDGAVVSALLYFRPRSSRVRPYLSVGTGLVHLSASPRSGGAANGIAPPSAFSDTKPVLHVPVGIDIKIMSGWRFRYSFAETSSANPISRQLMPPGMRRLANFRNWFGVLKYF